MKSIKAISILNLSLSTVLLLSACGADSTNPLAKYNGIKATTANDEKAVPQSIVAGSLFLIQLEGTNQINNGNFIEGQESELMIQVDPKSSSITKYSVQMTDFSSTDRPTLSRSKQRCPYLHNRIQLFQSPLPQQLHRRPARALDYKAPRWRSCCD